MPRADQAGAVLSLMPCKARKRSRLCLVLHCGADVKAIVRLPAISYGAHFSSMHSMYVCMCHQPTYALRVLVVVYSVGAHGGRCRSIDTHAEREPSIHTESCVWVNWQAEDSVLCDGCVQLTPNGNALAYSICPDVRFCGRCLLWEIWELVQCNLKDGSSCRLWICSLVAVMS